MLTRRQFLALGLASGLPGCVNLKDLQPNCPINWAPSLTAPVFYGYMDYGECSGASCISAVPRLAPGAVPPSIYDQVRPAMRVYYPTLDGTPSGAAILDLCERFPLVLLVHGDCGGNPYYQWDLMPAQLARCGYVVAVTQYGGVLSQGQTSDTLKLHQAESWLRTYWEHADRIMAPPNTAVIGHSYGATLAAQLATEMPLKAFASLSGVFGQVLWEPARTMLSRIQVPSLFCWNDNDDAGVNADMSRDNLWDSVGLPKHGVVFMKGHHGDYLRLNTAPKCPKAARRLLSRSRPRHRFRHRVHREVRAAAVRLRGIYLGAGQPVRAAAGPAGAAAEWILCRRIPLELCPVPEVSRFPASAFGHMRRKSALGDAVDPGVHVRDVLVDCGDGSTILHFPRRRAIRGFLQC